MSEALAGGNSKVAGQLFAYGHKDREATMAYYTQLAGGRCRAGGRSTSSLTA